MKPNFALLLSGAIVLAFAPIDTATAQSPTEKSDLGFDLKLNPQQRKAFELMGDFALDQMEAMITNGLDPKKLDRVEVQRKSETLQQTFSNLRLDDQQKAALRTILRTARDQMKRQMETGK